MGQEVVEALGHPELAHPVQRGRDQEELLVRAELRLVEDPGQHERDEERGDEAHRPPRDQGEHGAERRLDGGRRSVLGDHAPWSWPQPLTRLHTPCTWQLMMAGEKRLTRVDAGVLPEHPAGERQQRVARIAMGAGRVGEAIAGRRHRRHRGRVEASVRVGEVLDRDAQPPLDLLAGAARLVEHVDGRLLGQPGVRARVGADDHARPDHVREHLPRERLDPRRRRAVGPDRVLDRHGQAVDLAPRQAAQECRHREARITRPACPVRARAAKGRRPAGAHATRSRDPASARWRGTAACRAGRAPGPGPCRPDP